MSISVKKSDSDFITLDKILSWREEKQRRIPKKRIPNKESFYSEPDCAVETPIMLSIIARVSSSEKNKLIVYIDDRQWFPLYEENNYLGAVWIETLNFDFRQVEHVDKPWVVSMDLILYAMVSPESAGVACEIKFEEDWGYDERGFCWIVGEDWWYPSPPAMCARYTESW